MHQNEINCPQNIMPLYVDFAITYGCNAQCKHCSINALPNSEYVRSNDMTYEEICLIIDQLKNIGVLFVGLTGGEAITRTDIYDIVKYCNQSNMLVALATNGIALTEEVLTKLRHAGLNSMFVSLDHYSRIVHNEIRQNKDAYEGALNAIKLCLKLQFPLTVGITPMKDNYKDIEKTIEFLVRVGVHSVNISNFVPVGRGSRKLDLSPTEWKKVYIQVNRAMKKHKNKIRIQVHDVKVEEYSEQSNNRYLSYRGCLAGYTHCYILPNGDVQPCVMLPIKLGNVRTNNIKDILSSFQNSQCIINKNKLKGRCGECARKYECGGCRATAYAYYGDPLAEDPHCWFWEGIDNNGKAKNS